MRIMILIIALFSPYSVHAEDRTSDDEGVVSGWVNRQLGNDRRDQRLDRIEKRLDGVESKVDKLQEGQKKIEKDVDRLLEKNSGAGY